MNFKIIRVLVIHYTTNLLVRVQFILSKFNIAIILIGYNN